MSNLIYPTQAKKMGWKGQVTVSFIICEKGTVEGVRIIKSSGHKILDENVAFTIREVQPFPKPPVRAEIIIPVIYRLG
jgi:periplasmic protein TonB